jgi:membrane protease YdiL (CAAX protease family)
MRREPEPSEMARLRRFIRSVLPADLTQLIFLVGVVCLMVSAHARWNVGTVAVLGSPYESFRALLVLSVLLALFASFAGYYFSFWTVKRPAIRIVLLVIFPTVMGLVSAMYFVYRAAMQSALLRDASGFMMWHWVTNDIGNFSAGPQLCFAGLLLCLLFLSRLAFGLTTLPLALVAREPLEQNAGLWRNAKALIFFLIGPTFLLGTSFDASLRLLPYGFLSNLTFNTRQIYGAFTTLFDGAVFALAPILFLRKDAWNLIKRALRLPEPRYALFGLLVPAVVTIAISSGQFLVARAEWAHQLVQTTPPVFDAYFVLGGLHLQAIVEFAPAAFAEEIVFRGVLLALLTKRYGLHRGVFFVGMIWAAFHFPSDSYTGMAIGAVVVSVVHRIVLCLAMNYVLAWMTMRWNSVIPSGAAHTLSNIVVYADVNPRDWADSFLFVACWSVMAYILWRYWPITEYDVAFEEVEQVKIPLANPEPAG